jgi:beta-glucosidase-like glycosyl hydrolase/CubicO group peptidase (beta-lactamase class C family)
MKYLMLSVLTLLLSAFHLSEQALEEDLRLSVPFADTNTQWVDSLMETLTPEQRIAQLFMVAAYSNKGEAHQAEIERLVADYHIGGLMFMQGGPVRQLRLTNRYQAVAQTPLMIAQDAEWGLSMRIDSTLRFPWQMTLGALRDDEAIYEMGKEIGRQCNRLGVHINFAPVVDVNSNPKNPIINNRSFGESAEAVAKKGMAYMQGLQDVGVLACAKHFPGHGDTDADSHKTLPIVAHDKARLDSVELVPFKKMIRSGLGSMMVAHLYIPALDDTENLASTLSSKIVKDWLQEELSFEGLIFTDALNMKGVSQFYEPGEVDLKALLAGNDVLLFAEDVPVAIEKIKEAIAKKQITQDEIDQHCRKVLMAKKWFGLDHYQVLKEEGLWEDLTTETTQSLNRSLVQQSMTLLQNEGELLPLKSLDTLRIAAVSIGEEGAAFHQMLQQYAPVDLYHIGEEHTEAEKMDLLKQLMPYDLVLASVHKSNAHAWKSYHISKQADLLLQSIGMQAKMVLTVFANPYSLSDLLMTYAFDGLLLAYQNSEEAQRAAAQVIFGGIGADGLLPVTNKHFEIGEGLQTDPIRIQYAQPADLGISEEQLMRVDSIALDAITKEAIPGCQIMALKDGKVFYQKSFGHHTYQKQRAVKNSDLYDLASITKIAATVPLLMQMVECGELNLDSALAHYLTLADSSSKKALTIREILAHQAGLFPWIPFYQSTLEEGGGLKDSLYATTYSVNYPFEVAEGIYLRSDYQDSLFSRVLASKMLEEKEYRYSDLGYYLFKEIIESEKGRSLAELSHQQLYAPLGLSSMGYLPLQRLPKERIVPTEFDYYFRSQLLKGYVHDMGAAMQAGIGGHAGLFSNANDLAVLMQMYLQEGTYGGKQFFLPETISSFTECQFCEDDNRRGAGFDKAALPDQEGGPACDCSPSSTAYGHSGFTGTLCWVDPEEEFVYVFLSNRIHPTADNKKLLKMDVRTNIMEVFYEAIRNSR